MIHDTPTPRHHVITNLRRHSRYHDIRQPRQPVEIVELRESRICRNHVEPSNQSSVEPSNHRISNRREFNELSNHRMSNRRIIESSNCRTRTVEAVEPVESSNCVESSRIGIVESVEYRIVGNCRKYRNLRNVLELSNRRTVRNCRIVDHRTVVEPVTNRRKHRNVGIVDSIEFVECRIIESSNCRIV
ncbi:hypothetical protein JTB14_038343 [Gonioctena quinquepunctata]|nr:hypothetical protein JTB14_038343 [Gonioctena quinquepunctata]